MVGACTAAKGNSTSKARAKVAHLFHVPLTRHIQPRAALRLRSSRSAAFGVFTWLHVPPRRPSAHKRTKSTTRLRGHIPLSPSHVRVLALVPQALPAMRKKKTATHILCALPSMSCSTPLQAASRLSVGFGSLLGFRNKQSAQENLTAQPCGVCLRSRSAASGVCPPPLKPLRVFRWVVPNITPKPPI